MKHEQNNKGMALLALGVLGLCFSAYATVLGSKGLEPNGKIPTLWSFSFLLLSAYWVMLDARLRQIGSPYTNGFLLYVLWPFMMPAYAIKVSGIKGLLCFAGLVTVYLSPMFAYALSYALTQHS